MNKMEKLAKACEPIFDSINKLGKIEDEMLKSLKQEHLFDPVLFAYNLKQQKWLQKCMGSACKVYLIEKMPSK